MIYMLDTNVLMHIAHDAAVDTIEQDFGREVRRLRGILGISQEQLGELADIHFSYVSQIERGLKSPSLGVIVRLAHALKTKPSKLIDCIDGH